MAQNRFANRHGEICGENGMDYGWTIATLSARRRSAQRARRRHASLLHPDSTFGLILPRYSIATAPFSNDFPPFFKGLMATLRLKNAPHGLLPPFAYINTSLEKSLEFGPYFALSSAIKDGAGQYPKASTASLGTGIPLESAAPKKSHIFHLSNRKYASSKSTFSFFNKFHSSSLKEIRA